MLRKHKKVFLVTIALIILGITSISILYFNTRKMDASIKKKEDNTVKKVTSKKDKKKTTKKEDKKQEPEEIVNDNTKNDSSANVEGNNNAITNNTSTNRVNTNNQQSNSRSSQQQPASQPVQQSVPTTTPSSNTPSVNCNEPLLAGDYIDFSTTAECENFSNTLRSTYGLESGWRTVNGKCGNIIGCRMRIYINGNTYSKNDFQKYL